MFAQDHKHRTAVYYAAANHHYEVADLIQAAQRKHLAMRKARARQGRMRGDLEALGLVDPLVRTTPQSKSKRSARTVVGEQCPHVRGACGHRKKTAT